MNEKGLLDNEDTFPVEGEVLRAEKDEYSDARDEMYSGRLNLTRNSNSASYFLISCY